MHLKFERALMDLRIAYGRIESAGLELNTERYLCDQCGLTVYESKPQWVAHQALSGALSRIQRAMDLMQDGGDEGEDHDQE